MKPRTIKYTLGNEGFTSKQAIAKRVSGILHGSPPGTWLDGLQMKLILDLVAMHPGAGEKIGCGIKAIRIENNLYNTPGFILYRVDGTKTDISYKKCLNPGSATQSDLTKAFRLAIVDQVMKAYRDSFANGPIVCEFTGETLHEGDGNSHVDHVPPATFQFLLSAFLEVEGIRLDDVPIDEARDMQFQRHIADKSLKVRWQNYHAANAKLRVISKYANESIVPKLAKALERG